MAKRRHNVKTRHGVCELWQSYDVQKALVNWNMLDSDYAGVRIW